MHIRTIEATDAAAVSALSEQLGYKMSADSTRQQIQAIHASSDDAAFVAVEDNELAGWIHVFYNLRLECPPFCEIGGLVVSEQHRGKGIGTQLIAHAAQWCAEKGCKVLKVRCNTRRTEAHLFYERNDFTEQKQQKMFLKIV